MARETALGLLRRERDAGIAPPSFNPVHAGTHDVAVAAAAQFTSVPAQQARRAAVASFADVLPALLKAAPAARLAASARGEAAYLFVLVAASEQRFIAHERAAEWRELIAQLMPALQNDKLPPSRSPSPRQIASDEKRKRSLERASQQTADRAVGNSVRIERAAAATLAQLSVAQMSMQRALSVARSDDDAAALAAEVERVAHVQAVTLAEIENTEAESQRMRELSIENESRCHAAEQQLAHIGALLARSRAGSEHLAMTIDDERRAAVELERRRSAASIERDAALAEFTDTSSRAGAAVNQRRDVVDELRESRSTSAGLRRELAAVSKYSVSVRRAVSEIDAVTSRALSETPAFADADATASEVAVSDEEAPEDDADDPDDSPHDMHSPILVPPQHRGHVGCAPSFAPHVDGLPQPPSFLG